MTKITSFTDDALIAWDAIGDAAVNIFSPGIRLGVTGLSRAGKTVFITALVHNIIHGGRMPLFSAQASGRLAQAYLEPQPDDDIPRFRYEDHLKALLDERIWPQSTSAISELRLTIEYESASGWKRTFGRGKISIDIVDYPGEWLLDLPLLGKTYQQWSKEALQLSRQPMRAPLASTWHGALQSLKVDGEQDETLAGELSAHFTQYLQSCRDDRTALSTLSPGRFLMPGDLVGSPALTFAPLDLPDDASPKPNSLHAMMARRYESYKSIVIKPFFRQHFARLDRQIIVIDVLQALNAGPASLADLENALSEILGCFRPGRGSLLSPWFTGRTNRLLFAATKADHLHHQNHDALEALLSRLVANAIKKARFAGAKVEVVAMAAIRATREATLKEAGETLPVIVGTPMKDQTIDGVTFDGNTETAIFPGDLPSTTSGNSWHNNLNFVRFRPPKLERDADGLTLSLPHIRLDRALEFLIGDQLQ